MRKAAEIQPKGLEPGIYFGLDDETYFRDTALNYSAMKDLLESEATYWHDSPLNPNWEPPKTSDEMEFGKAVHRLLLEPDTFFDHYYVVPGQAYAQGKKSVRRGDYVAMVAMVDTVAKLGQTLPLMDDGAAEVVLVWKDPETGIRCKAKHDWFAPFWSLDYKAMESVNESIIKRSFQRFGYRIQHFHYLESRKNLKEAFLNKKAKVFGATTKEEKKLAADFTQSKDDAFVFLVGMKKPPYAAEALEIDEDTLYRGATDARDAVEIYCNALEQHGLSEWPNIRPYVRSFSDYYGFNR